MDLISGNSKAMQQTTQDDVLGMIKDLSRRVRVIEERYGNLRKTMQVTEQNMLSQGKKTNADIRLQNDDIAELKKLIRSMGDEIKLLVKEARDSVKKDDVKVLEKYISFWQPLSYVTHAELEKAVSRQLKKEMENYKSDNMKRD